MPEPRKQFTFYRSYFDAIQELPKKDQSAIILAVCVYALYEEEPAGLSPVASTAFKLIRPTLDAGRKKAANGKNGGTKRKQNESKPEANGKQTASEKEGENEKEKEREKENECYLLGGAIAPAILLPLNDGSEFPVPQVIVDEFAALYPSVDVMQQLRNMRGWLLNNPKKRKTKGGIKRFINSWLAKEQDRFHGQIGGGQNGTASGYPEQDEQYGTWV